MLSEFVKENFGNIPDPIIDFLIIENIINEKEIEQLCLEFENDQILK